MTFRWLGLSFCLFLLVPLLASAALEDQEIRAQQERAIFNIGIVTDGSTASDLEMITLFQQEIQTLAEEEFLVKFPTSMLLSGKDTVQGVNLALDRLFANPDIDLVLTLGTIASSEVLRRKKLPKPVVAPYVVDSMLQQLPREEGTSGSPNLTYIDSMFYMDQELLILQKIVPFKSLAILLDRRELSAIPEISQHIKKLANEHTMTVNGVAVKTSASEVLAAIPDDTEAVMVGPLYHFSDDEIKGVIMLRVKLCCEFFPLYFLRLF